MDQSLTQPSGTYNLIAYPLYGSGLRLLEALRLRVKDMDFKYGQVTVRPGKNEKVRRTILPRLRAVQSSEQLARVRLLHEPTTVSAPLTAERKF